MSMPTLRQPVRGSKMHTFCNVISTGNAGREGFWEDDNKLVCLLNGTAQTEAFFNKETRRQLETQDDNM